MGRFVTLKKIRSKIWDAKSRVQKTGSLLFKKRRGQLPLLFLNNNDLVFCTLLFAADILDPVFLKFQTLKKYQVDLINYNSGWRLTPRLSHIGSESRKTITYFPLSFDIFYLRLLSLWSKSLQ